MEKVKLSILGLSPSQSQQGSFALILIEDNGQRRLPIIIGVFEAQAIALELENIRPNRPMTHDLFKSFADSFDFRIDEIQITNLDEGIFYAKLVCHDGIRQKIIDARPSDAVAIAVRFNAPIYTTPQIMEDASISSFEADEAEAIAEELTEEEISQPPKERGLQAQSLEELRRMLDDALSREEYEKAAKIRDEIEKRN